MSTIERITQLSHRIFNTSVTEKSVARHSNPFAASNFQKNILSELNKDVFVSSLSKDKVSLNDKLTASSKRIYSTFVGSISDFGNRIIDGIESIKAFGSRMKNGLVSAYHKIKEIGDTEISLEGTKEFLSRDIKSFMINGRQREITKMSKMDPHTEVKPMLADALSALESDMVQAA